MAAAREVTLLCITLLALFSGAYGSATCFISNSYYKVCQHGCCGTFPYEECCSDLSTLIIGLVVGAIILIILVIAIVCFVLHQKSNNKVVRLVESAHSRGDTANITILHMSSNNPYERMPHPHTHSMTMGHNPNQPAMPPPVEPSGFHQHGMHQHHPASGFPTNADPAFPPGNNQPEPMSAMPQSSLGPGMMMPQSSGGHGMMMPPTSSMNGGPVGMRSMGPAVTSTSTLPAITPRNMPPLPVTPVAAGVSENTPPPRFSAFGAPMSKAGSSRRESTSLGTVGNSADKDKNMGVEDIEDFY